MIYIAIIVSILMIIIYSCIATATAYDQRISDREQEAFLKSHNK